MCATIRSYVSPKVHLLKRSILRSERFAILKKQRLWANLQPDVSMLATRDDIGCALTEEEEAVLLSECLRSRSRQLYVAVLLALNTCMRYTEIRLLQVATHRFSAKGGGRWQVEDKSRSRANYQTERT